MKTYTFLFLSVFFLTTLGQETSLDKNLFLELKTILEKFEDKNFPEPVLSTEELIAQAQQVLIDTTIIEKLTILKSLDQKHADFIKKYQSFCRVLAIICYKKMRSDELKHRKIHVQDIKYVFGLSLTHILNTEFADIKETLLASHENKFFKPFNSAAGILFIHNLAKKIPTEESIN